MGGVCQFYQCYVLQRRARITNGVASGKCATQFRRVRIASYFFSDFDPQTTCVELVANVLPTPPRLARLVLLVLSSATSNPQATRGSVPDRLASLPPGLANLTEPAPTECLGRNDLPPRSRPRERFSPLSRTFQITRPFPCQKDIPPCRRLPPRRRLVFYARRFHRRGHRGRGGKLDRAKTENRQDNWLLVFGFLCVLCALCGEILSSIQIHSPPRDRGEYDAEREQHAARE